MAPLHFACKRVVKGASEPFRAMNTGGDLHRLLDYCNALQVLVKRAEFHARRFNGGAEDVRI